MTNAELAEILEKRPSAIKVSMSKAGIYLIVDGVSHIIDETQACIIWDLMPTLARLSSSQEKAS